LKRFAIRKLAAAKRGRAADKLSYFRNENRSEEIGWSAYSVGQIGGELLKVADVEGYKGPMKIIDEA